MDKDLQTALNEIEAFVRVRCTLDFADEATRRLKAQILATRIGDSFAGQLSEDALVTMQRAYMLKDLLTTFGSSERITDWTTVCLSRIQELRQALIAPADFPARTGEVLVAEILSVH